MTQYQQRNASITISGGSVVFSNDMATTGPVFAYVFTGHPLPAANVTVIVEGHVAADGTCDVIDTYTGAAVPVTRTLTLTRTYDYFLVYATWTDGQSVVVAVNFTTSGVPAAIPQRQGITLQLASAPPASATATGAQGTFTWDAGFIYVCVAPNTWKRVAISTF